MLDSDTDRLMMLVVVQLSPPLPRVCRSVCCLVTLSVSMRSYTWDTTNGCMSNNSVSS